MLPTALVHEIDRLLDEGQLSHRRIAAHLNVSRGVVSAIANGSRGLYGKDPIETGRALVPTSPPTRCSGCGFRVYLPCRICIARQHRYWQRLLRRLAEDRRAIEKTTAKPSGNIYFRAS
jgi:hypothetical protein